MVCSPYLNLDKIQLVERYCYFKGFQVNITIKASSLGFANVGQDVTIWPLTQRVKCLLSYQIEFVRDLYEEAI